MASSDASPSSSKSALLGKNCDKSEKKEGSTLKKFLNALLLFILTNLLPIGLIMAVIIGTLVPSIGVTFNHPALSYVCLIGIFLISGLYMRTDDMLAALKAVRATIWSFLSILFISCVIGSQIIGHVKFQDINTTKEKHQNSSLINNSNDSASGEVVKSASLRIGMQIFFLMPCTVSSGVVMVAQLGGSEILALLLTVISNIVGVVTVAPMFTWLISDSGESSVKLNILSFLQKAFLQILIPVVFGKCLQFIPLVKTQCAKYKKIVKIISVLLLVLLVFVKISAASHRGLMELLTTTDIFTIIGSFLGVHCLLLIMNSVVSLIIRLPIDQIKCVTILCSQKTMAVAVAVLSFMPAKIIEEGLGTVTVIICHLSMILFDSFLISIWLSMEQYVKNRDSTLTINDDK